MPDALVWVALLAFVLALRVLAMARQERREAQARVAHCLDETHKFLALVDTGAREEAGIVLVRLSQELRRWTR